MTAENSTQTRTKKVFQGAFMADAKSVKFRIGDICPNSHAWEIDALVVQHEQKEWISG